MEMDLEALGWECRKCHYKNSIRWDRCYGCYREADWKHKIQIREDKVEMDPPKRVESDHEEDDRYSVPF